MKKINWSDITKFKKEDFSEDPDKYAEPELIYRLNYFRIKYGLPIYPSPVSGALARFDDGTSQHSVKKWRLSNAVDVFPEGYPIQVYNYALSLRLFNGIGIYLDTTGLDGFSWIMFHFDIRDTGYANGIPLIWIAEKIMENGELITKYRYPQIEPKYWSLLKDDRLYKYKKFGIRSTSKVN